MKIVTKHKLKTWPEYFKQSQLGYKNFELRLNDRDFKVGDLLILYEWDPKEKDYTNNWVLRKIIYILKGPILGLASDYCILSLNEVHCEDCEYCCIRENPYPNIEKDMYCTKKKFGCDIKYKNMLSCLDLTLKQKKIWQNNTECPQCGKPIKDPKKIRANETGYSYCSDECARTHVEENTPEGGY